MEDQRIESTGPVDQHLCLPRDAVWLGLEAARQQLDDLEAEVERRFPVLDPSVPNPEPGAASWFIISSLAWCLTAIKHVFGSRPDP
jgi:hypothetical protein